MLLPLLTCKDTSFSCDIKIFYLFFCFFCQYSVSELLYFHVFKALLHVYACLCVRFLLPVAFSAHAMAAMAASVSAA